MTRANQSTEVPPAVAPALLVIAEIEGFTRFTGGRRTALAHAQVLAGSLVEALMEGSIGLELVRAGASSALFCLRGQPDASAFLLPMIVARGHARFSERRAQLLAERTCRCGACGRLGSLGLKFVAHAGEIPRVNGRVEMVGPTAKLVRRMIRNSVPVADYLLVTDPVFDRLDPSARTGWTRIDHDFDGFGRTVTYFLPLPAGPGRPGSSSRARKVLSRILLEASALPLRLLAGPRAGGGAQAAGEAGSASEP